MSIYNLQKMKNIVKLAALFATILTLSIGSATANELSLANGPKVSMVYGVLAGVGLPRISETTDQLTISNGMGFHAGAMMGVKLKSIEFMSELWYNYNRATLDSADGSLKGRLGTKSVEMPLLVQIPVASIFRINFGPVLTLMCNSSLSNSSGKDVEFGRIRSTAGWVIGGSATIWGNIILDARFNGYFKSHGVMQDGSEYIFSQQCISFNIGYRF